MQGRFHNFEQIFDIPLSLSLRWGSWLNHRIPSAHKPNNITGRKKLKPLIMCVGNCLYRDFCTQLVLIKLSKRTKLHELYGKMPLLEPWISTKLML